MNHSDKSLEGKRALITGVGRRAGIGAAIARAFALHGADIFITWFAPYDEHLFPRQGIHEITEIMESLEASGVQVGGTEIDLGGAGATGKLFELAESAIGKIDILVNNAVHDNPVRLAAMTEEDFDTHYRINMRAPALLCKEFFQHHDGRPGGRVINLTSGQGLGPMPEQPVYAATKGGLEALTVSLAPDLASKQITINAIDPGPTDTGWMDDETRKAIMGRTPLGRLATPEDAARLAVFLAGPESQWITGQVIRSRGGFS